MEQSAVPGGSVVGSDATTIDSEAWIKELFYAGSSFCGRGRAQHRPCRGFDGCRRSLPDRPGGAGRCAWPRSGGAVRVRRAELLLVRSRLERAGLLLVRLCLPSRVRLGRRPWLARMGSASPFRRTSWPSPASRTASAWISPAQWTSAAHGWPSRRQRTAFGCAARGSRRPAFRCERAVWRAVLRRIALTAATACSRRRLDGSFCRRAFLWPRAPAVRSRTMRQARAVGPATRGHIEKIDKLIPKNIVCNHHRPPPL